MSLSGFLVCLACKLVALEVAVANVAFSSVGLVLEDQVMRGVFDNGGTVFVGCSLHIS